MALWKIEYADGRDAGYRNSGDTAEQAIKEWNEEDNRVHIGVRYHEEFLQRGECSNFRVGRSLMANKQGMGNVLFCDFKPIREAATNAIQMKEIWIDAGYARVPA